MFDHSVPLHCSSFRIIPYVFALKLDDMPDFKRLVGENAHTTLTEIKGCAFIQSLRVSRNNTWQAHTESPLIHSPFSQHYKHLSISPLFTLPQIFLFVYEYIAFFIGDIAILKIFFNFCPYLSRLIYSYGKEEGRSLELIHHTLSCRVHW